ncbi:MAG: hypothetical protein ABIW76_03720 [Fibrobacteria bacterium]
MEHNDLEQQKKTAESHLWDYLRSRLEKTPQPEAAQYLQHFLKAQAGEPKVRGDLTLVPFDMYHRVSDYTCKLDAMTGENLGWHFEVLAQDPGDSVPVDKALEAATAEADLPKGAVLKVSEYEQVGDAPVFIARWEHEEDGIPVERDYIHVLVNGKSGRPFARYRKWHALRFTPVER